METKSNSIAFEIRFDVLKLAHNDCFELFNNKRESIISKDTKVSDTGIMTVGKISEEELAAIYPTTEQILERAKELYKFICEK